MSCLLYTGGMCYKLFNRVPLNWTEARDECRTKGLNSDLVAIHNIKEQGWNLLTPFL